MKIEYIFNIWLDQINQTEHIDCSIIAFNFGLFETTSGYTIYLIGSKTYSNENEDWATCIDFEPKLKYLNLNKMLTNGKTWQDVLDMTEKLISSYINTDKFHNSIFKCAKAITMGFDDGNLTLIKKI